VFKATPTFDLIILKKKRMFIVEIKLKYSNNKKLADYNTIEPHIESQQKKKKEKQYKHPVLASVDTV